MKKVFFLLLFFVVFGAANMSAQVRIGGDGEPHTAAVLDLNVDDTDTGNKGALALPRVSLATNTDELNGATPLIGMLVYNTNASMIDGDGVGIYYWVNSKWVKMINSDFTVPLNKLVTTKTDSGRVLVSNGTTVTFSQLPHTYASSASGTAVVYNRGPVTWTIRADTTLTFSIPPRSSASVLADGLVRTDVCALSTGNGSPVHLSWQIGVIWLTNHLSTTQTTTYRIRCFRPSY